MPPKKKLKIDPKQTRLSFERPNLETTDSDKNNNKQRPFTSTDTDADKLEKPKEKKERHFQECWKSSWAWLDFKDNKMFYKICMENKKSNAFTSGCQTFKTSSMIRHEASDDHTSCSQDQFLKKSMETALKKSYEAQDDAVIKALKIVYWLASENIPLSKYDRFLAICNELDVPGLQPFSLVGSNTVN